MRYIAFAIAATCANLLVQRLVIAVLPLPTGITFGVALVAGTGAGLVLKYILDKRWIFFDRSSGVDEHARRFSLYVVMGIATTVIFWGTETAFWLAFGTTLAREVGGVLGLSVGYYIKYRLDRRFVFSATGLGTA